MRIAALHAYPVKSCAALALEETSLDALGFTLDRRFAFLDGEGNALTQRTQPMLRAIRPWLGERNLHLDLGGLATLSIPLQAFATRSVAQVWGRQIAARLAPPRLSERASAFLGAEVVLAALEPGGSAGFVDAEPVLVTTQATLSTLAQAPAAMERFRPNIVVEGAGALEELAWRELHAGNVALECVKPCGRCEMVGQELLQAVSAALGGNFGVYCRVARPGRLARGDSLRAVSGPR